MKAVRILVIPIIIYLRAISGYSGPILESCTAHLMAQNSYYHNHILKADGVYKVLFIDNDENIHLMTAQSLIDAHHIVGQIPKKLRLRFDELHLAAQDEMTHLSNYLKSIAVKYNASVKSRVKTEESIREKLFRKAAEAKKIGRYYNLEELEDILGFHFILPNRDTYLNIITQTPAFLDEIGIKYENIMNIDPKDIDKNKFNKPLKISFVWNGINSEIQIMTELMHLWQAWNYKYVSKSTLQGDILESMREYSSLLADYINQIESGKTILTSNIEFIQFDNLLKKKYSIPEDYGFLSKTNDEISSKRTTQIFKSLDYYTHQYDRDTYD